MRLKILSFCEARGRTKNEGRDLKKQKSESGSKGKHVAPWLAAPHWCAVWCALTGQGGLIRNACCWELLCCAVW